MRDRSKDYRAGAEVPLLAKLRVFGLSEPEFMSEIHEQRRGSDGHRWEWLPFSKLRYKDRRLLWNEFNLEVDRRIKRANEGTS